MSNLSGSGVTNSLLAIIAVLLLVLIIQNASQPMAPFPMANSPHSSMMTNSSPQGSAPMGDPHQFHDHETSSEFNPTQMIYAALKCPADGTLTLSDPACSGGEADKRRQAVDDAFNQGLPIPQIFDAIIKTFGEKALTQQAIDIRRARRG